MRSLVCSIRMIIRREPLLILILFGCSACYHAALAAHDSHTAESEIRVSLERWTQEYNAGHFDSTLFVWSPDVVGWGYRDWTKDAGVPASRPNGTPASGGTYSLTIDEIRVMGQAALVRDRWAYQPPPSAKSSTTIRNRSFEIWEKGGDGRWRITRWITQPEPK